MTFRGTIEYRSVCTQPIKDSMSVAAFHVGLKHKTKELEKLFFNAPVFNDCYNSTELRKLFIKTEIPSSIDQDELYNLARDILDLAKEGLKERNLGEEIFLEPLYRNVDERTNPGKRILDSLKEGISLEKIIKDYGDL